MGSELCQQLAAEYRSNCEGCYVINTAYCIPNVGRLCFDATRRYRDVGRLINHSSTTPNLKLSRPLHVRGKWRLALLALTDIKPDEELNCNYGVRSLMWMKKRARNITAAGKGEDGTREEEGSVKAGRGDEGVRERRRRKEKREILQLAEGRRRVRRQRRRKERRGVRGQRRRKERRREVLQPAEGSWVKGRRRIERREVIQPAEGRRRIERREV